LISVFINNSYNSAFSSSICRSFGSNDRFSFSQPAVVRACIHQSHRRVIQPLLVFVLVLLNGFLYAFHFSFSCHSVPLLKFIQLIRPTPSSAAGPQTRE